MIFRSAIATSLKLLGPIAALGLATAAFAAPPSAADFGRTEAIRNVTLSPDGKHIAAITSPDGVTSYISLWSTEKPDAAPYVIGCGKDSSGPLDCYGVSFLKNDRLGVTVRQLTTRGVNRFHSFRYFITDLKGSQWQNASGESGDYGSGGGVRLVATLPKDPKNVMVLKGGDLGKMDVYTGRFVKTYTTSDKFGDEQLDLNGEVRARLTLGYDGGKAFLAQYIRDPKTGDWSEHFRWYAQNREPKEIVGFTEDPNVIFLRTNEGRDKAGIYLYDISARKVLEPAFEIKLFDASGVIQSDDGVLLGFSYAGAGSEEFWTDGKMAALTKGLRKALGVTTEPVNWTDIASGDKARFAQPVGADVGLSNWSDDMKYAIVVKSGPSQPAEYYLLSDQGKLSLLGKSRPWFKTDSLGDTRLVQYPARDGLMIPAYLTTPNKAIYGNGPYPTIVTPHGGPWARDYLGWDGSGWTQYFASRGYAVLQPQYRGSQGWGQKLWRAGDNEWGQKMQDDKDDGVKWLIQQKIAAPDRVAMHGYSYGGYAAMAAAVRPNGLYQCAIAGAGVAELDKFRERLNQSGFSREFQRSTISGLQPLDHADEVSIPIFLYHGNLDTTVPPEQSERFVSALKAKGKPVKYLELKDMGHQSNRWEPGQVTEVLTAIDNYLRTECGPGGL